MAIKCSDDVQLLSCPFPCLILREFHLYMKYLCYLVYLAVELNLGKMGDGKAKYMYFSCLMHRASHHFSGAPVV